MRLLATDRHERAVGIAGALAEDFAGRAARFDASGEFPHENFDAMRESGYLALTVPAELGGLGGDLTDLVRAQERLATGCGSTALAVNMHLSMVGQAARAWRTRPTAAVEETLRGVVDGSVVLAGATAERGHSLVRSTGATATRVDGGYLVTGRKVFGTGSAVMTHMTSMAVADGPDGPEVVVFRVPAGSPGVRVVPGTWNATGMRATRSEDVELTDVWVPDPAVVTAFPVGHLSGTLLQTLWGWAMPSFGALYLGIAVGAYEHARTRLWSDGAASPYVRSVVAECEVLAETARAVIARTADEVMGNRLWTTTGVQEGTARAVLAKHVGTTHALRIVDLVVRAVGSPALQAGSVYDRAQRDVRAGTVHPYNPGDAQELLAATALGLAVAPEHPPAVARLAEPSDPAPHPVDTPEYR